MQGPRIEYQVNPRFVPDDIPVWLGNNKDAALIFDNANDEWTVQTRNAAGTLTDRLRIKANTDTPSPDLVDNPIKWTAGRAVTAADYSIGRDLDATNQLHVNVPTGATFELSVNDTPEFVVSATQIDLKSNDLVNVNSATITGATGNTLIVNTNTLVVDATNKRVGFGIALPLVLGHFKSPSGVQAVVRLDSGSATDESQLGFFINGVQKWVLVQRTDANSQLLWNDGTTNQHVFQGANIGFGRGAVPELGAGDRVISIANALSVPTASPASGGVLYAEAGALKWKGSGGTVTTIALA
jgi:hypothetical protein